MHPGMPEGEGRDQPRDMSHLSRARLEELQSRGDVVEEIPHLDLRPWSTTRIGDLGGAVARHVDPRADRVIGPPRRQGEARDGSDRWERLSTKSQRGDRVEILGLAEFARRVSSDREGRVRAPHPDAVVHHEDPDSGKADLGRRILGRRCQG